MHQLGNGCPPAQTILDPLQLLDPFSKGNKDTPLLAPAAGLLDPVYPGNDLIAYGLGSVSGYGRKILLADKFYPTMTYISIDAADDPLVVDYTDGKGDSRTVRLFTIQINWPGPSPAAATNLMQVGQELDTADPSLPSLPAARRMSATYKGKLADFHHHIKIDSDGRHFHVALFVKDRP
jgi:hypothetical protein